MQVPQSNWHTPIKKFNFNGNFPWLTNDQGALHKAQR